MHLFLELGTERLNLDVNKWYQLPWNSQFILQYKLMNFFSIKCYIRANLKMDVNKNRIFWSISLAKSKSEIQSPGNFILIQYNALLSEQNYDNFAFVIKYQIIPSYPFHSSRLSNVTTEQASFFLVCISQFQAPTSSRATPGPFHLFPAQVTEFVSSELPGDGPRVRLIIYTLSQNM